MPGSDDSFGYDDSWQTCHTVGISGGCGYDCPVFLRGDCDIQEEIIENGLNEGMKEHFIDWGLIDEDPIDPIDPFDDAMEILK